MRLAQRSSTLVMLAAAALLASGASMLRAETNNAQKLQTKLTTKQAQDSIVKGIGTSPGGHRKSTQRTKQTNPNAK